MIKCEICGRTIDEIVNQDGNVTIESDRPFVCDSCQQKRDFDKQIEILRKAMAYDEIKKQLDQQKVMWQKLKEWLDNEDTGFIHEWADQSADTVVTIYGVLEKMQELEQGEKDGTNNTI